MGLKRVRPVERQAGPPRRSGVDLRAGKRQAWTPIRSPVGCGIKQHLKGLKRVTPGERQAGPPRRSDGCGLGAAFACAVGRSEKLAQSFKVFKRFKGLRAGKRQAWTPTRCATVQVVSSRAASVL